MTGFGARAYPAAGVHDELFAKALVVELDRVKVALVALDILQLDPSIVAPVRETVQRWTGIPASHLMLNALHTHSGPGTYAFNVMGQMDAAYCDVLARLIATAVKLADNRLQPAAVKYGTDSVVIGQNRRQKRPDGAMQLGPNPGGPYDPTVHVVVFELADGTPVVLTSHAAHPVVLGGRNLDYTADYCGYACSAIEQCMGPKTLAMFLQGFCGNINADIGDASFAQAERLGRRLAGAALKAVHTSQPVDFGVLGAAMQVVPLPLQNPPTVQDADKLVADMKKRVTEAEALNDPTRLRNERGMVDWATRVRALALEGRKERIQPMTVQAFRFGEIGLCAHEAETFIEYAQFIQERSPFGRKTLCLGYTNGCIGYLPTAVSYPDGGYEVNGAIRYYGTLMLAPESEKVAVDASVGLLQSLNS
jgi:hypothetical protein